MFYNETMTEETGKRPVQYLKFASGRWQEVAGEAILEKPVSLTVNGEVWITFMCTPVHLEALAIGFLFNEGLITSREEIASVRVCPAEDNVDVWLEHNVDQPQSWRRTSGCTGGVTGVTAENSNGHQPHPLEQIPFQPDKIGHLIGLLLDSQDLYRQTGGVHTSALSDGESILLAAEDIGRHNTLDKLAGRLLLEEISVQPRLLLTTGRISSEMLQKAARIDASVVISRTSPSSLSIEMAESWGITLIGYARRDRFQIYSHPERIRSAPGDSHTDQEKSLIRS